jgi:hypothetical protein
MRYTILAALVIVGSLEAGDWQFTGAAGFGDYRYLSYQSPAGDAQAGIGPRYVLNAGVGRAFGDRFVVQGEWTFQDGDFEISSGGRKTAFDANAYSVQGDVLFYLRRGASRWRPYLAGGSGAKLYHGQEAPHPRPLGQFGSFRDGIDARPLFTFGGGVEVPLSTRFALRLDVRDYATPFPASVIVAAPGSNLSGWLHDLVAVGGLELRIHKFH